MINVAIQAAKYAPAARTATAKLGPVAQDLLIAIGVSIGINETMRAAKNRHNKRMQAKFAPETFEINPERPLWKKMTNTHADETWGQGVGRRSRIFWDICTYGVGSGIGILNVLITKPIKGLLFLAGKVVHYVAFSVASVALGIAFGLSPMSSVKFVKYLQSSAYWTDWVAMKPFEGVRWIDHQITKVETRLCRNRDHANIPWYTPEPKFPGDQEIKIDTFVKPEAKEDEITEADVHHIAIFLTADETQAKRAPKRYGKNLVKDLIEKAETKDEGIDHCKVVRQTLEAHLRDGMALTPNQTTQVLLGFDEALEAASSTTATS